MLTFIPLTSYKNSTKKEQEFFQKDSVVHIEVAHV